MRFAITAAILISLCSAASWADDIAAVRKQAESGDAAAQYELAQYYSREADKTDSEKRATRDRKRAFDWCSRSAEQGLAEAQFSLGRMYMLGQGVVRDSSQGVGWQLKAAEQGLAEAQFEVGMLYLEGAVLEPDPELALEMLTGAANQHYLPAQKQLGTMYFQGAGVTKDLVQAHMWFSAAALSGDDTARGYLPTLESIMDAAQIDEARALAEQWRSDHKDE